MKTGKVRNILFFFLIALFAATIIGFAFTAARYSGEKDASSDGGFSGSIDYIVSTQTVVHSVEEFLSAVANGYPNIKIADDVPNPFLVTSGMEQVFSDLILDLNGHDIQRNSRDPMLEIADGVKMVVIDTSNGGSGSFYNPVGSVLSIKGGTLTVISGTFESGVRKMEYYDATGISGAHGTIAASAASATLYIKQADSEGYSEGVVADVPVITPRVSKTSNGGYYVNGNLYVDSDNYSYLYGDLNLTPKDTYLYFAIEDADASNANDIMYSEGSADFYYEYYVKKSSGDVPSYVYYGVTKSETDGDDVIKVTVYGYFDDIASAKNETDSYTPESPSNFAAIQMESGYLYVRGGNYYSYFGVDSAYCVYATGGLMSVENGSFEALEQGVCIDCSFPSYDAGGLSVSGGSFQSYLGDTIQVNSGKMSVTGGTFKKDATAGTSASNELDNKSAIAIRGGMLTVVGADDSENTVNFEIYGSYACGIECASGSDLDIKNAVFLFNPNATAGTTNVGIYNKSGDIEAESCLFRIPDDNSTGIVSTKSTTAEGAPTLTISSSIFSMTGKEVKGIRATAGTINLGNEESIGVPGQDHYVMFYIDHVYKCYGVYVESDSADAIAINANTAQFIMGQYADTEENTKMIPDAYTSLSATAEVFNGAGIFMDADNAKLDIKRAMICSAGSFTAGVYMKKGTLVQETDEGSAYKFALLMGVSQYYYGAGGAYDGTFIDETNGDLSYEGGGGRIGHHRTKFGQEWFIAQYGSGHYASGGTFNIAQANARGSYGVFTSGGSVTVSNFYVALYSTYGYAMYSKGGTISVNNFDCDVRISRLTDEAAKISPANSSVTADVTSAAIRTNGGDVNICQSNVITSGYGYIVEGGNLVFKNAKSQSASENLGKNTLKSERATAVLISNGTLEVQSKETLEVDCAIEGSLLNFNGEAVQPDGIYVEGGSLESLGALNMTFKGLENDDQKDNSYQPLNNTIKSYAIRVSGSEGAEVDVVKGVLDVSVGGGVYVKGGNVVLGTKVSDPSDIQINATGNQSYNTARGNTGGDNWDYYVTKTGGHAVKVEGGDVTIYNGTYASATGNALMVTGGNVIAYNGSFIGGKDTGKTTQISGLGSYYGLLLVDGGTVDIYAGDFQGYNGGAFVSGSATQACTANIYQGNFAVYGGTGTNGFSIGGNATVNFGTIGDVTYKDVTVAGTACAISIENNGHLDTDYSKVFITFNSGEYIATGKTGLKSGVIYRGNTSSNLIFNGGHFKITAAGGAITSDGPFTWFDVLGSGCHAYTDANGTTQVRDTALSSANSEVYIL